MKALAPAIKNYIYQKWVYGPYRRFAKPVYDALIAFELGLYRLRGLLSGKHDDPLDTSQITAIIKTFERPQVLRRLVKSIQRRYPELAILVVDDSQNPQPIATVETITMPYDSGISAGRNRALEAISTPYFLLLDDDFVFSHHQQLAAILQLMMQHDEIDIVGGRYIDLPLFVQHAFQNTPVNSSVAAKTPLGHQYTCADEICTVVDKVQNYFVGRTETVKQVKWDPALKVNEHTDFFNRAKGKLTTVFHPRMRIVHAKTPFNLAYMVMRYRS